MDKFSDLQTALQSDLNITSTSSLYPLATIKLGLNRAYIKCGRLFRWPQLEDAKVTGTEANIENYDFPTVWSPDSAWKLEVDGDQYGEDPDGSPMDFADYLIWKDDNENSSDKKWAIFGNQYFIYPVPTADGTGNISVWGQKNVIALSGDDDLTIFSYTSPECNEAVVLEAAEILKRKGEDPNVNKIYSPEAKQILTITYNKIRQERAKMEKTQPFFEVPDYFGKTTVEDVIGNF